MSNNTVVFYTIPSDHDSTDHPNAFVIKKPVDELRVVDIRSKFPLPGIYHFRFKAKVESLSHPIWLDVSNDELVPTFQGRVIMKVLRMSWGTSSGPAASQVKPTSQTTTTLTVSTPTSTPNVTTTRPQNVTTSNPSQSVAKSASSIDFFGNAPTAPAHTPASSSVQKKPFDDFFA
eukprot:GDKK01054142.1.p1 GENE.GDKK01054142.1~~GDKK01054142.1.p1  ORF type:complete len:184 (+),score=41.30 GDKK01054142.1:28-552(+)